MLKVPCYGLFAEFVIVEGLSKEMITLGLVVQKILFKEGEGVNRTCPSRGEVLQGAHLDLVHRVRAYFFLGKQSFAPLPHTRTHGVTHQFQAARDPTQEPVHTCQILKQNTEKLHAFLHFMEVSV